MITVERYIVKNFQSEKPSRLALIMMLVYSFLLLTRRKEVIMSDAQKKQELDQNKNGQEVKEQDQKSFFSKMKDTLSSDNAKVTYATLGVTAVIAGIAIAIQAGLTTAAISLMAGGAIAGGVAFYKLRLNKTPDLVPA